MIRLIAALIATALVAGCVAPAGPTIGPDGRPLPQVYRIGAKDEVQFRVLDGVNALRGSAGVQPVRLNAALIAAAATHARDMAVQNRPWHFGSDGSSPIDRARRAGYAGAFLGENISETYESELQTLGGWMEDEETRRVILDRRATDLGIAWFQEPSGKIWWVLTTGAAGGLGGAGA